MTSSSSSSSPDRAHDPAVPHKTLHGRARTFALLCKPCNAPTLARARRSQNQKRSASSEKQTVAKPERHLWQKMCSMHSTNKRSKKTKQTGAPKTLNSSVTGYFFFLLSSSFCFPPCWQAQLRHGGGTPGNIKLINFLRNRTRRRRAS